VGALEAISGIGLAADIGGRIAGGLGGGHTPTAQVSPYAEDALRVATEQAQAGLEAAPALETQEAVEAYRQSAQRLADLGIPTTGLTPEEMTRKITETAREVAAPEVARQRREYREAAGAYGPTTATAQAQAGAQAQAQNYLASLLAQIRPQLESQKFQEDLQKLQAAIGLEQARQNVAAEPQQLVNQIRQGYLSQLGQIGAPARAVPTEYGTPGYGAILSGVGQTAMQLPTTYTLARQLREGS
jgi:hypothetical protein